MNQDRRTFIKVTSLASATLIPVVSTLLQACGKNEEEISTILGGSFNKDLDFHVIDNNLLNLHFYFINIKKSGSFIIPDKADNESFMVVRLPQMHVSEKGYWDSDWTDVTHPENKYPKAKLSGYSYLAFQLWPDNPTANQHSPHKKLRFTLENVLNWNDQNNFELITLVEWFKLKNENINKFEFLDLTSNCNEFKERKIWNKKTAKNETYYETSEPIKDGYKKYKSIVTTLFECNYNSKETPKCFIPITFFEVPQEVCLVPISRDATGKLSKVSKQFWQNKFVNQEKQAFGYRKYEIWNNTLFYKTAIKNEKEQETTYKIETPSFRIAGLITEQDVKCETQNEVKCQELQVKWEGFLPSLLDKAELAFLTQYANDEKNNRDYREAKYDIKELNGFFFTGLGIITHLKYYNEDAPKGVDLIEYEHIITEGRDIFIKVARIGIHNKNGKRYKHVVEGKRKITDEIKDSNGNLVLSGATSFVELKQYCECIEKKKNYEFPENPTKEVWSIDSFESPNFTSHEVFEPSKSNKPHYRRYPWKELRTIEKERIPIKPYQDGNESTDPFANLWFWPVLEKTISNPSPKYLNSIFDADDWDKGTVNLATPFIFIRKSVIECGKSDEIKNLTNSYFKHNPSDSNDPINLRRKIGVNNQKIAFTKPLPVKVCTPTTLETEEELLNQSRSKTHIIETEYLETYFNFTKQTAFDDIKNPFSKVRFPLLPQVLRAKVFVDHIRDLTQQKIPSIIEYHENYIAYDFVESVIDPIDASKKQYANAAKQILANTDAFSGRKIENGIEKWGEPYEERVNQTYSTIKNALQEAKDKLGNLAVPDIVPDTISLEKFGVTLPKGINESIAKGKTVLSDATSGLQKIASFNPRELLRGKLSDVCGLDLTAILDELIPAGSACVSTETAR